MKTVPLVADNVAFPSDNVASLSDNVVSLSDSRELQAANLAATVE